MALPVKEKSILVATNNKKKLAELQRMLASAGITILSLADVPRYEISPESGATFEDVALLKAREGAAATGLPTIADDSGLSVDALNGMPGVLSARWSGQHGNDRANWELLLAQLVDVPGERRGAGFVCAMALVTAEGEETVVRGEWRGSILTEPRGTNGFGYDPIFLPHDSELTAAELPDEEKDAASHRGQALKAIIPHVQRLFSD